MNSANRSSNFPNRSLYRNANANANASTNAFAASRRQVRFSPTATKRLAMYTVGPLSALRPIAEHCDGAALVPLRHIDRMFVNRAESTWKSNNSSSNTNASDASGGGGGGGGEVSATMRKWTIADSRFQVSEIAGDSPFYVSRRGQLEKQDSVLPSKITSMKMAGDRAVHEEILLGLQQRYQADDWYIIGTQYEHSDIQPYIHSQRHSMADRLSSNTDLVIRGVQHRLNIRLSDAKLAQVPAGIGPVFGYNKNPVTQECAEGMYNVVIPLHVGGGTDYTFIQPSPSPDPNPPQEVAAMLPTTLDVVTSPPPSPSPSAVASTSTTTVINTIAVDVEAPPLHSLAFLLARMEDEDREAGATGATQPSLEYAPSLPPLEYMLSLRQPPP